MLTPTARTTRFVRSGWAAVGVAVVMGTASVIGAGVPSALASGPGSTTEYRVPGNDPFGTAFDSSGRVWVALPGCDPSPSCASSTPPGKLALFDPASSSWVTVVSLPAGYGQPLFVQVDSTGKVWFTMPVTNSIGVYDPVTTTVTQWAVPTAGAGPWDLAIDSTGKIWFTEHYANQIGSFDPSTQTFQEIATPATNSNPYGITVDPANNIWFTENTDSVALIGEYTNAGVLNEYKIRNGQTAGSGLTPHLIVVAPNGNIWWSEGWVSAIGTLNPAAAQPGTNEGVTEYPYVRPYACSSHTSGISADTQGNIWLNDSLQNIFGSFPVGGGAFSFYNSPSAHPHDGLNVDSQNRVWFPEEFVGKLVEVIPSGSPSPSPSASPTPGTVLGTDTFHRANQALWGKASDGQAWGGDAICQHAFSISSNAGLAAKTGGNTYSAVLGPAASDEEAYATGRISTFTNSNFGEVLRYADDNDWYAAYINGHSLVLQEDVGGTTTTLATVPFTAKEGTSYTIHFRVVGSTLTANVWPASGSEPSGWMITATDSSLATGQSGMRFLTQGGTATITGFTADVPGGSSSPTPTPTPTPTPSPSPSPSPSPTPGTVLGADTFQRANQALWGTASDGLAWGADANHQAAFSVSGNAGQVANTGGTSYNAVLGPAASDEEVYATGSMSVFSSSNFGDLLRYADNNNWYKAYITGKSLILQKKVAGAVSTIASVPFTATAGTSYTIHFRVVGSTLTANVWPSSGSEPSGWMITATDSSLTAGQCGMRFLTQTGTATITAFTADTV